MRTIKNLAGKNLVVFLALATFFSGCAPPGRRALMKGQRMMQEGDYPGAIANFKIAASRLTTNALVWNCLGLAYHHTGQFTNAEAAYRNALAQDRGLAEAHFNIGCARLDQNLPDYGKAEFMAFTTLRPNAADGWVKAGVACLRLHELPAAENDFKEALRLNGQNPEALNGLGIIQAQRNRPRDAANSFDAALKQRPHYAPALLNLAIISQVSLNNRPFALQKYREYLALSPRPPDWDAVSTVARELDRLINPAPRASASPPTNVPAPIHMIAVASRPAMTANAAPPPSSPARSEPSLTAQKIPLAPTSPVIVETVQVPPHPVFRSVQDIPTARPVAIAPAPAANTNTPSPPVVAGAQPDTRDLLQRVNPVNLSRRDIRITSAAPSTGSSAQKILGDLAVSEFPRYSYHTMEKPGEGDHPAAERIFAEGVQAQRSNQLREAIQAYRRAVQLDPAYYDAHYRLGIAAAAVGNLPQALTACESALTIRPDSPEARIYFAQTLKQANYPVDAALQLETVLESSPNDSRAHLALGNLYAQQLRQPAKAREHYQKVLEYDPHNREAPTIRYWLAANPR